jgi:HrpA-like RNA helicase
VNFRENLIKFFSYAKYYDRIDDKYVIPEYEDMPVLQSRKDLLDRLETHQIIIVTGETGSGKSTQVPQYILDHFVQKNENALIWVTQPRRIAATSIAERVADSRSKIFDNKG